MAELVNAMKEDDLERARGIQESLHQLMSVAFIESNPIPIKAALSELGRMDAMVRSPLTPLAEVHRATVRAALESAETYAV